jgi:YgiT-type zinc finger domain-containing protein
MNNGDETVPVRVTHGRLKNMRSRIELQCEFCGSSTDEDVIRAVFWTDSGPVVVEDIPVRLCEGCREQFFEEEIARRIREVLTCPPAKAKRQIRVPVYSMSRVGVANKGCHPHAAGQPDIVSSEAIHQQGLQAGESTNAFQGGQESFHCKYCESKTIEGMVKSALWVGGRLLAIEDIPARVCQRCKEQFYDDKTAEKMAGMEKGGFPQGTTQRDVVVMVFSLADGIRPPSESHYQVETDCPDPMRRLTITPNKHGR